MSRRNIFLDPGADLEAAIEPIVAALTRADGVLPASSQADPDSYYGCGNDLDADDTQRQLLLNTGGVIVLARWLGFEDCPLTPLVITDMHDGIFRPVFGDRTLGFRTRPGRNEHREDDGVEFPYWVVGGAGQRPQLRTRRGVRSNQVRRRVEDSCRRFEQEVPGARDDADRGAFVIAQLYTRLIRIHPFGDGNGRTAWAAVQLAAGRLRLPFVQSSPTTEARVALGDALRHGDRVQPLADRIREAMWSEGGAAEAAE